MMNIVMRIIVVGVITLFAFDLFAYTEKVGDVVWSFTIKDGEATIEYDGVSNNSEPAIPYSTSGELIVPASLGGCPVTKIGDFAFANCQKLTSIIIPEGVTSIGRLVVDECGDSLISVKVPSSVKSVDDHAFHYCSGLRDEQGMVIVNDVVYWGSGGRRHKSIPFGVTKIANAAFENDDLESVTIPSSVTNVGNHAFYYCNHLTSVSFSDGLVSIGDGAFRACSSLMSVSIPSSVTSIGDQAFLKCSKLASVTLSEGLTSVGYETFRECGSLTSVLIPSSVTNIGMWAFLECSKLASVTLSEGLTSIGEAAFRECRELASVTIPSSLTSIGGNAVFSHCSGLTSVTISEGVKNIGLNAFSCCSGLTSVTIPSSVESIESGAFYKCEKLASVILPGGLRSIGNEAFSHCSGLTSVTISEGVKNIGLNAFSCCSGLTSVTIPSSVDSIESGAFYKCEKLASVILPGGLRSIGNEAFRDCGSLTSVAIPSNVTSIGDRAFRKCSNLASVTLSEELASIGDQAFAECYSLLSVTIPPSVTSIGNGAFGYCSGLTAVRFEGEAPDVSKGEIYGDETEKVTTYVRAGTSGWGEVPGAWCGRPIELWATYPDVPVQKWAVTFDLGEHGTRTGGGELVQEVADGEAAVAPEVQAEDGWAFVGWDSESTCVTEDKTIHAAYKREGAFEDGAYIITTNGYTWAFSVVAGEAIVEQGITPEPVGELVIPSELGGCPVTGLGYGAFADCVQMTSVKIPSSVMGIDEDVFCGNDSLESIVVDEENELYSSAEGMLFDKAKTKLIVCPGGSVDVTIPAGVTNIGYRAFYRCYGLTSVTIPEGVTTIGGSAFDWCESLTALTLPASVLHVGDWAFASCRNLKSVCFAGDRPDIDGMIYGEDWLISENVTTYVRAGTSGWGEVPGEWCGRPIEMWMTYPDLPKTVEDGVYVVPKDGYDWTVTVADGEVWIGDCDVLLATEAAISPKPHGKLVIPDEFLWLPVVGLNGAAFVGCEELTEVSLPRSLYSVSPYDFYGTEIRNITVDAENPLYMEQNGFLMDKEDGTSVYFAVGKTGVCTIPEGVTSVSFDAFVLCAGITELKLPDSVFEFNADAVEGCSELVSITVADGSRFFVSANGLLLDADGTSLVACPGGITDVVVPEGVKNVGVETWFGGFKTPFVRCSKMRSIAIPSTVEWIVDGAFSVCSSLTNIVVDSGNDVYNAANGLLMTADGEELHSCAGGLKEVVVPVGVMRVSALAFADNANLSSVTLPVSVEDVGMGAFSYCRSLTSVCFEGDAPAVEEEELDGWRTMGLYEETDYVTTYVREGTSGWGKVPGVWQGRPLKLWTADDPSPIPDVEGNVNFALAVLNGSQDEKLAKNFRVVLANEGEEAGVAFYNAYRDWAGTVRSADGNPTGLSVVHDSLTAWTSFALDQMTLLDRNPTDGDLVIEEFKPSMVAGTFDLTVSIKDVVVGPYAMAENLKKTFGLEGATELVFSAFDEANVDIEFGMPEDGKLKFTAGPLDKDAKTFFMKMSVK